MFFAWDMILAFFFCVIIVFLYFIWKKIAASRNELEIVKDFMRLALTNSRITQNSLNEIEVLLKEFRSEKKGRHSRKEHSSNQKNKDT